MVKARRTAKQAILETNEGMISRLEACQLLSDRCVRRRRVQCGKHHQACIAPMTETQRGIGQGARLLSIKHIPAHDSTCCLTKLALLECRASDEQDAPYHGEQSHLATLPCNGYRLHDD